MTKINMLIIKYINIFFIFSIFFLLFSTSKIYANNEKIEEVAPIDKQRDELIPNENFFKRNQYWTSSVIQLENTPYFTLSTRSNSLKNKIVHDFFMSISGKNCNRIKIMIFIDEYALLPEINNQFGQIHFDNGNEYNFEFFVIKRRNKNIIGFYPNNNVDMLILNMQKCEFMSITMPSVGKKIYYDLRGFSKSFQRAALMCNSTRAN